MRPDELFVLPDRGLKPLPFVYPAEEHDMPLRISAKLICSSDAFILRTPSVPARQQLHEPQIVEPIDFTDVVGSECWFVDRFCISERMLHWQTKLYSAFWCLLLPQNRRTLARSHVFASTLHARRTV